MPLALALDLGDHTIVAQVATSPCRLFRQDYQPAPMNCATCAVRGTNLACVTETSIGKGMSISDHWQRRAVHKVRQGWQRGIHNVRGVATWASWASACLAGASSFEALLLNHRRRLPRRRHRPDECSVHLAERRQPALSRSCSIDDRQLGQSCFTLECET